MKREVTKLSDEDIVRRMQAGELMLFEELVKRYQTKLVHYAQTIVYDYEAAVDIVQDGLIKGYKKINSCDPNKKFSSWIFRIIHNQAIDYIRKHKREVALQDQEWILNAVATKENREEEMALKLQKQQLDKCMQVLPIDYRSVLTLYYMEEKSYQEISDILRIPAGTVATRLSRGKRALAQLCGEEIRL